MIAAEELFSLVGVVTREVLETMFFSEAEPVECRHSETWKAAKVRFDADSHNSRGEMTVMLSRELAISASAGFLAEENEEVTEEQENQVSCELANIICGAILSRLHPNARVTLSMPEVAEPDFAVNPCVHQCFATPDGMMAVTIRTS
jgi:Chemotaxis phosphatase CheX